MAIKSFIINRNKQWKKISKSWSQASGNGAIEEAYGLLCVWILEIIYRRETIWAFWQRGLMHNFLPALSLKYSINDFSF